MMVNLNNRMQLCVIAMKVVELKCRTTIKSMNQIECLGIQNLLITAPPMRLFGASFKWSWANRTKSLCSGEDDGDNTNAAEKMKEMAVED